MVLGVYVCCGFFIFFCPTGVFWVVGFGGRRPPWGVCHTGLFFLWGSAAEGRPGGVGLGGYGKWRLTRIGNFLG